MPNPQLKYRLSSFGHNTLRLPYRLHVRHKRIKNPLGLTYVLVHGLADTGDVWRPLLDKLPKNANYVVLDLLGHGLSKQPESEQQYSAYRQAINVRFTYATLGLTGPIVLIGHSFGSLVAAEFAHHYHRITKQLILCAPPIYREPEVSKRLFLQQETILREIYRRVLNTPKSVMKAYDLATKLKLLGFSQTDVSEKSFPGFAATLRAGIISQTAGSHLEETTVPTIIIYGIADPLIVISNLTKLAKMNPRITTKPLAGSHAVRKNTIKAILDGIEKTK